MVSLINTVIHERLGIHKTLALLVIVLAPVVGALFALAPYRTLVVLLVAGGSVWLLQGIPQMRGLVALLFQMRWWQFLWLALFLSGQVLRVRTTSSAASNPLDAAAAYRTALVMLVAAALAGMMALKKIDILGPMSRPFFVPLLLFNITNIVSTVWSVNPPWTLYKSIEFTVDTALIAVITSQLRSLQEFKRLFDWTWFLFGLLLLSVGFGVLYAPDQAIQRGLGTIGYGVIGVYPSLARNGVGHVAAILTVVALCRLVTGASNRRPYLWLLAISVFVLIISQTRSALIPVLIAVPIILLVTRRWGWAIVVTTAVVVTLTAGSFATTFQQYMERNQNTEMTSNLTGRTNYWALAWDLLLEQPFSGYGAYAGGRFMVAQTFGETLSSTHGTFPEILVGTSFWGAVPIFVLLVGLWFSLARASLAPARSHFERLERAMTVEALAVLTVVTVRSIFTVTLIWHPSLEFLVIVGYAEFLRRQRAQSVRERGSHSAIFSALPIHGPHARPARP